MTGKTHVATGIATGLIVARPDTFAQLGLCLGVSYVGSIICDIDVNTSESHKGLNIGLGITSLVVALLSVAEYIFHFGIKDIFLQNSNLIRIFIGLAFLIAVCVFGEKQPHRTFMHSFLGIALTSGATYIILPKAALLMAVAMISHVFLDLFNKQKVMLLYPSKKLKISFGFCYAKSRANDILFFVVSTIALFEIVLFTYRIVF